MTSNVAIFTSILGKGQFDWTGSNDAGTAARHCIFMVNMHIALNHAVDGDRAGLILYAMQYAWPGLRSTAGVTDLVHTTCTPTVLRCKESSAWCCRRGRQLFVQPRQRQLHTGLEHRRRLFPHHCPLNRPRRQHDHHPQPATPHVLRGADGWLQAGSSYLRSLSDARVPATRQPARHPNRTTRSTAATCTSRAFTSTAWVRTATASIRHRAARCRSSTAGQERLITDLVRLREQGIAVIAAPLIAVAPFRFDQHDVVLLARAWRVIRRQATAEKAGVGSQVIKAVPDGGPGRGDKGRGATRFCRLVRGVLALRLNQAMPALAAPATAAVCGRLIRNSRISTDSLPLF